jgi:hypothetical protein
VVNGLAGLSLCVCVYVYIYSVTWTCRSGRTNAAKNSCVVVATISSILQKCGRAL